MKASLNKKQLLFSLTAKDFKVETFRAGGKGGQKQNKTSSGVRIKHPDSGAVGESREHRSQLQNKKAAFIRLTETDVFKKWFKVKCSLSLQGIIDMEREVNRLVDEMMEEKNLRIEYLPFGVSKWE